MKPIYAYVVCSDCGWENAPVKQAAKWLMWYCDRCGSQHFCRTKLGDDGLRTKIRILPGTPPPEPLPAKKKLRDLNQQRTPS